MTECNRLWIMFKSELFQDLFSLLAVPTVYIVYLFNCVGLSSVQTHQYPLTDYLFCLLKIVLNWKGESLVFVFSNTIQNVFL